MERKMQAGEKCPSGFTKRIRNTTFNVAVHFAENTTDTLEDRLLHLFSLAGETETAVSVPEKRRAV